MRHLLIKLILTLFIVGCGQKKKDDKMKKVDFTATTTTSKTNAILDQDRLDSIDVFIRQLSYDSAHVISNMFKRLSMDDGAMMANVETGMAPEIIATMFPDPKPYEFPVATADSPCDDFYTIERNQFRSGTRTYYTSVTRTDDNKIKLFKLVKGEFKKNSKAFILDFCNYLDTTCLEDGIRKKVRLAAGLRIVYFVKDWGLTVGVDGLEKIAAAKELNFSESSLEVHTIGWGQNDAALDSLKNALQKITVKNYPEACAALINLLGAYKTATSLKPDVIPME